MWRHALSELRLHPGRYVATLLAIAISVGFISAISVFINSQQYAMQRSSALPLSTADLVITVGDSPPGEVQARVASVAGVEQVAPVAVAQFSYLSNGERTAQVSLYDVPEPWQRWAQVVEGRLPENPSEVGLSRAAAADLHAAVGDILTGEGSGTELTLVGITDDPRALFATTGYTMFPPEARYVSSLGVLLQPGASAEAARVAVEEQLSPFGPGMTVETGDQARAAALLDISDGFDFLKYLLQAFAAVALLVGAITIANTFTILAAQRRRQTGLLRAVGASPGQVMGRLMVEALLLGAVGSLAGLGLGTLVGWLGGFVTESNFFGLVLSPAELSLAWLAGVIATFVAAVVPSLQAARGKPLEALQTVPTAAQGRAASITRIVVCGVAMLAGAVLVVLSRTDGANAIWYAIPAGIFLTIGVLGGAPLYIAPLLRRAGRLFGWAGPTTRLALTNSARNPQRAASTATALMLAVGLIVTLQVALATSRSSAMESINESYPTDLAIQFADGVPAGFQAKIDQTPGVATSVEVQGKRVGSSGDTVERPAVVLSPREAYEALGIEPKATRVPADSEVIVASYGSALGGGATIELQGVDGPLTLVAKPSDEVSYYEAIVSPGTFAQLAGEAEPLSLWVKLTDRTDVTALNRVVRAVEAEPGAEVTDGGAMMASLFTQIVDVVLIVMTALLGVAVLIALVGVANTLSLSVIERQRESALLRALGMQRSGLRLMLLIEAVALVAVGTVIGLACGSFFGWLGVSSVLGMMPIEVATVFALDGWYTAGLVLACLAAAVLASVLPGRRAAGATPTEALAVE